MDIINRMNKKNYINDLTCVEVSKKVIVIAGEWHSQNLGDEIICNTFRFILQSLIADNSYQIVAFDISYCKKNVVEKSIGIILGILGKFLNRNINMSYNNELRRKYVKQRMKLTIARHFVQKVIFPGGALFQGYFEKCISAVVQECQKNNISVYFNACGYGPNTTRSRNNFRRTLLQPCIKQITTRDNISELVYNNVLVVPDVAVLAYKYYNFIDHEKESETVGINIISPVYYQHKHHDIIDHEMFTKIMLDIIKKIAENYKVVLFTNGDILDYGYAYSLYDAASGNRNIVLSEHPGNGFKLIKNIQTFSIVIGFRLHSLITAYSFNIPNVGIIWDNKVAYWEQMIKNRHIYQIARFPVDDILSICDSVIKNGIDKKIKHDLEEQIIRQIKTYI
jgi:polysaccharide pyruvyl transferase WcaK-like protein